MDGGWVCLMCSSTQLRESLPGKVISQRRLSGMDHTQWSAPDFGNYIRLQSGDVFFCGPTMTA